eukprot:9057990-Alexandrium_andersonii.AAC.1
MTGAYQRDTRTSWWFANQPGMDLLAFVHFHFLPVAARREVMALGNLPGPRHAASLMHNIDIVVPRRGGMAPF